MVESTNGQRAGGSAEAATTAPERPAGGMDRPPLVIALGLALFGALILWDASRLADLGGYSQVGPATVPKVVGWALIGLAVWTVIAAFKHEFPERPRLEAAPFLWVLGGLVAQLVLLFPAGFSIATGLLFALTARGFGYRNLAVSIPVGIALSFAVWVVFSQLLQLHLPSGPLENLFF